MKNIFKRKPKDLSIIDDKKIYVQTLEVILTKSCNLRCEHCLRGDAKNEDITIETLDALFSKTDYIQALGLGGGEIALKPELVDLVYKSLIKNNVNVESMNFTTNGTILNDELLSSLNKIKNYIANCRENLLVSKFSMPPINVCVSVDDYHLRELKKQNINFDKIVSNMVKYKKALGEKSLILRSESDISVINVGRATELENVQSVPFFEKDMTYPVAITKNVAYIGGILCVSTNGDIVPPNTPFELENELSYGNIKNDNLSTILKHMNTKQVSIISMDSEYKNMINAMINSKKDIKRYLKAYGGQKRDIIFSLIYNQEESERE